MSDHEKNPPIYGFVPPPPMVNGLPVFAGVVPLKEENPFVAGLTVATIAGTGMLAWEVAAELIGDRISQTGDKDGSFTKTAKKHLFGKGIGQDAYKLFERGDERNTLKQATNFAENSWGVAKKAGGALGEFGQALSKTSTGKWMMAAVTGVAAVGGIVGANDASKRNQKILKPIYGEVPPLGIHSSLMPPAF